MWLPVPIWYTEILGNSAKLSEANTKLSNKSPYSRITPIAKNVVSYAAEAGLNISAFFKGNQESSGYLPPLHVMNIIIRKKRERPAR